MRMNILTTKLNPDKRLIPEYHLKFLGGPKDLKILLKESDYLTLYKPLTEDTQNIISETEFKQMK